MTFNMRQLAGVLLIAVALLDFQVPSVPVKPDLVIDKPSISVVLPSVQSERRVVLAEFYVSMSEILLDDGLRDPSKLNDTADFAAMHASALGFAIKRKDIGTVPGLGEAIDKAFFDAVGEDVVPLDDSVRSKLAEVCLAIAWEIMNG